MTLRKILVVNIAMLLLLTFPSAIVYLWRGEVTFLS
jgi:hypothetical protein